MPLDHNIFLQAAQMTENRNQNLLNNLSNSIQNAQAMKLKKQELASKQAESENDPEKLAAGFHIQKLIGEGYTLPEAAARYQDMLDTRKLALDEAGRPYKINSSIFEGGTPRYNGMARPADQPQPVGFNIPPMDDLGGDFPTGGKVPLGAPLNVNDLLPAETPEMDARRAEAFQRNTAMQNNGFDLGAFEPAIPQIEVPPELRGNPKAEQKYLESAASKAAENAAEKQKEVPKASAKIADLFGKMDNLNSTLDEAISMVGPSTAGIGSNLKDVPIVGRGTRAKDLESILNTIKADAAFSELQTMRDNSPTGGALGQVSERELALLTSAAAALDQEQSPAQLAKNLKNYKRIRNESLKRVSEAYEQTYGKQAPSMGAPAQAGWSIRAK